MKTEFIFTKPEDLTPQCLEWLQVSVNKTPNSQTTLEEILEFGKQGNGEFYLVKSDKSLGCIFIEWLPHCMNVVLLGGDYIKDWRDEFHDFCVSSIRAKGIKQVMIMGRYGIGKIFPELKPIGMVFVFTDEG